MKFYLYLLFTLVGILTSCKSLPFESITLSHGGGFTGFESQHIIDNKGHVFIQNLKNEELKKLGKFNKKQKQEMSTLFNLLKLMPTIEEPSNMTRKLVITDTAQAIQHIWPAGMSNTGGHEAVYNHIMNTISSLKK